MSQDFIDSVLDSFQDQPSNLTMMREYEKMAKTHLNRYFEVLGNKPRDPKAKETGTYSLIDSPTGICTLRPSFWRIVNKRHLNLFGIALLFLA